MSDKYKPTWKVSGLKLARDGYRFAGSWKVPSAATSSKAENCFTHLLMRWSLDVQGDKGKQDIIDTDKTAGVSATSDDHTFGEFKHGKKKKGYKRGDFYPCTKRKLNGVNLKVRGRHLRGGKYHDGPWTNLVTYKFKQPRKPTVALSYNEGTQVVSYTIETDPGKDNRERHDTVYRVYVARDGMKNLVVKKWTASTAAKITGYYDMNDAGVNWSSGAAASLHVEAYARGLWGDSAKAAASHKVVWPKRPVIAGITAASTGRVTVAVKVNKGTVGTVQLQRQRNLAPGAAPDGESWSDVDDAVDNGNCSYLFDLVGDARSARGLHTWYRLKVSREGFHDYSEAKRADALFREAATAANDEVGIVSLTPLENGTSLKVVVGFNEDDPNTGTEVAWSTDPNAWRSTAQPSKFQYDWKDSPTVVGYASTSDVAVAAGKVYYTRTGGGTEADPYVYAQVQNPVTADIDDYYVKFAESATVIISGLTDGTTYHVSARRYLEGEDATTYTPWADIASIAPAEQPSSVTLSGPGYVARGESIELAWVFDGTAVQTGYQVHPADSELTSLAGGEDALGAAVIPPEAYGDAASLDLFVTVETGGEPIDSNTITVGIADAPEVELGVPATAAAHREGSLFAFEAYSATDTPQLACKCSVGGESNIAEERPDGSYEQFAGDTVWADVVNPAWASTTWSQTVLRAQLAQAASDASDALDAAQDALDALEEGDEGYAEAVIALADAQAAHDIASAELAAHPADGAVYAAEVELPEGVWLVDGGAYAVEATPTDTSTGLSGSAASGSFEVAWAHQAPAPSDDIAVEVDEGERTATIALSAPQGAAQTDVYDLYRGTFDGFQLIRSNLRLDDTVTDRLPAFGERSYCVCLRTADGDRDWMEYGYELPVTRSRFDWPGGYAELRFDLAYSDSSAKRFQAREHSDGGTGGYFRKGVNRSGSYTATVVEGVDDASAVNALSLHDGACFCRTPDGKAFQCNADVNVSATQRSPLSSLTFPVRRMDLTGEFMVADSDIEEARDA